MMARSRAALAAMVLVMATTACGRGDRESATVSQGDVVNTAALRVTDLELGRAVGGDKQITDKTDEFRPNDTIFASVKTTGTAPGILVARWTFEDGQVVDESTQNITPTGDAATEFHISKPDGLPKGKYKVEILLGGTVAETEEFEVK